MIKYKAVTFASLDCSLRLLLWGWLRNIETSSHSHMARYNSRALCGLAWLVEVGKPRRMYKVTKTLVSSQASQGGYRGRSKHPAMQL
jgi:hypothetical protein